MVLVTVTGTYTQILWYLLICVWGFNLVNRESMVNSVPKTVESSFNHSTKCLGMQLLLGDIQSIRIKSIIVEAVLAISSIIVSCFYLRGFWCDALCIAVVLQRLVWYVCNIQVWSFTIWHWKILKIDAFIFYVIVFHDALVHPVVKTTHDNSL